MSEFSDAPAVPSPVPHPNPPSPTPGGPGISPRTSEALRRTRPWVMFMSILMWVGVGFMLIGGVFMLFAGVAGSAFGETGLPEGVMFVVLAMVYGLMAFLYIFPAIFLWRYASRIGRMLSTASVSELEGALEAQKSFWKFIGIMTIVVMAFYAVMAGGMIIAGIIGALN